MRSVHRHARFFLPFDGTKILPAMKEKAFNGKERGF
jgi:hypothetical protein